LKQNYEAGWLRHDKHQRVSGLVAISVTFSSDAFAANFEVRFNLGLISEVAVACAKNMRTILSCVGKPGRLNRPYSPDFCTRTKQQKNLPFLK
jgi:hypothetical protein